MNNIVAMTPHKQRQLKTLQSWIEDALTDPDKVDADGNQRPISGMTLVHLKGEAVQEIHSVRFTKGKSYTGASLHTLFRGKADSFAQGFPGVQTFQLMAFYGQAEPEAFQPFQVMGTLDNNGQGTEAPDDRGERQQKMRWTDAFMTQMFMRQQQLDSTFARTLELQNKTIELLGSRVVDLQSENIEAIKLLVEGMAERATNQNEAKMQQLAYERQTQERQAIIKSVPYLANTILGKEVFPQSVADTALLEQIAESITVEQAMQLAQMIDPKVAGVLLSRFNAVIEKKLQARAIEEAKSQQLKGKDIDDDQGEVP